MKTRATSTAHGHVIIMSLIVCLLLGTVLVGVISLSTNEGQLTGRSQSWNGAIPVAEAGIEEAFTHLKYCPTNRASNGWTLNGTNYTKGRTNNDSSWYYHVSISTNYEPTIVARGGIRAPLQANNYIVRTVRVTATNEPMFSAAIEASELIDFSGGGVTINSYDSRQGHFFNADGTYNPAIFNDKGRTVCHYGPFNMGNAKIYGKVETGEGSALTIGAQGVVGSKTWHLNNKGIQPEWHTSTTSSEIPSNEDPGGGQTTLPMKVNNTLLFTNANQVYRTASLQNSIEVTASNVTIIVTTGFAVTDFVIHPQASLILYVGAKDVALRGIRNLSNRAESFQYYGLPSNRTIDMGGNAGFCGILCAPDAALKINGGGANEIDFMGAIIARTVTVVGKMQFHFDESVQRLGSRGFIANRWDELTSFQP